MVYKFQENVPLCTVAVIIDICWMQTARYPIDSVKDEFNGLIPITSIRVMVKEFPKE